MPFPRPAARLPPARGRSRDCCLQEVKASRGGRIADTVKRLVLSLPLECPNINERLGELLYASGVISIPPHPAGISMKIGTLLTTVILSLSAVGGGLAVYVAATKHDT